MDPDIGQDKTDRFNFWIHLATPLSKVQDKFEYKLELRWKIVFELLPPKSRAYECVRQTEYWLEFGDEPPILEDVVSLAKRSYTFFTVAYIKKIREEVYKPPKLIEYPESVAQPIVLLPFQALELDYWSRL